MVLLSPADRGRIDHISIRGSWADCERWSATLAVWRYGKRNGLPATGEIGWRGDNARERGIKKEHDMAGIHEYIPVDRYDLHLAVPLYVLQG